MARRRNARSGRRRRLRHVFAVRASRRHGRGGSSGFAGLDPRWWWFDLLFLAPTLEELWCGSAVAGLASRAVLFRSCFTVCVVDAFGGVSSCFPHVKCLVTGGSSMRPRSNRSAAPRLSPGAGHSSRVSSAGSCASVAVTGSAGCGTALEKWSSPPSAATASRSAATASRITCMASPPG